MLKREGRGRGVAAGPQEIGAHLAVPLQGGPGRRAAGLRSRARRGWAVGWSGVSEDRMERVGVQRAALSQGQDAAELEEKPGRGVGVGGGGWRGVRHRT